MVKCFLYVCVCVLTIIPILGQFKRIYRKRIIANNADDEDDDDGYDNTKDSLCLGFIRINHMYG